MLTTRSAARQTHAAPALRYITYAFLLGLLVPLVGTALACAGRGGWSWRAAGAAQARSPLLHIADFMPFVIALVAPGVAPRRAQIKEAQARQALMAFLLALTLLPIGLLQSARREDARAAVQFADVNAGGSLRGRSVWLYGAGQRGAHVPLAARTAQIKAMRAILGGLRTRYPADVAVTDNAWRRFDADFAAGGRVDWASALAMRDGADTLTRRIENQARAEARQSSGLLLGEAVSLASLAVGSLVLLCRLQRAEKMRHQLGALLSTTTDLIGMADAQGRMLYLNAAFRRFLCMGADDDAGQFSLSSLLPAQARARLEEESRPAALAAGVWEGETVLLHPVRGEVSMSQLLLARPVSRGAQGAYCTVIRDITRHKAVETALLEAEALFRSAVSAMQEGFLVQDGDGRVLMANQCAEEIMGLSPDEMVGQVIMRRQWRAVREDGTPFAREDHPSRRALRTGQPQPGIIMGLDKPDQARLWLSVSAAPLFHAGETTAYAAVSTFSDITAQKEAADALRDAQQRLSTIVGSAPVVLFSVDAEGVFTTSEGKGLEMLGLTPGQVVGQSLFDYAGDNAVIETYVRRALAGETVSYVSEVAGHMWETRCSPIAGADGRLGVIGLSFDVSGRLQAEQALRQGEERLRRLYEVTSDAALSFGQKMERLMQMGCAEFGLEAGTVAKLDETLFEVVHSYALGGQDLCGMRCDPRQTFCHEAILHDEPLGIEHIGASAWAAHPAYQAWKPEAYLGAEVQVGGQPFGTLCFTSSQPHAAPFTAGDKDLLRLMAQWVGSEMQRRDAEQRMRDYNVILEFQTQQMEQVNRDLEQANAQLATLASTDSLTGLCNRRTLGERLAAETERARRYKSPLSLLLMDVDEFKQYNDAFGHPAGDHVLRTVGQMLTAQARLTDLAARYGGEEFAVVLPETDAAGALVVAERIRRAMEHQMWPLRAVTISVGICTLDADMPSADALLAAADSALYRSKAGGRNRVTHAAAPRAHPPARQTDRAA